MKVGDLVRCALDEETDYSNLGVVINIFGGCPESVPPICHVLWSNGSFEKDWFDELEVVSASR